LLLTTPPGAASLRALIFALSGDDTVPIDVRNECHLLMMAIDRNDLPAVSEHVRNVERLAEQHHLELPGAFRDESKGPL
jgi:hypothetical protein